jgi:hypothetical protein
LDHGVLVAESLTKDSLFAAIQQRLSGMSNIINYDSTWSIFDDHESIQSRDVALTKRGGERKFEYDFLSPIDGKKYAGSSPSFPVRLH